MSWLDSFLVRAVLAGLGVAIAAAPLGCFVVWRRMAYFGDATAHASILGIALALAFSMSIFVGVLVLSLLMAVMVSSLGEKGYAMDTVLGVLAHSALAFGLVVASFLSGIRLDLMGYLFGDILAVGKLDLLVIWCGVMLVLALMRWRWSALLTSTLSLDLAYAAGIDPRREQFFLTISLAMVVAVAIKVIGALLIVALLIIPAATARIYAKTPEQMALISAIIGAVAVVGGLQLAYILDTPAGPTIVCLAAIIFALTHAGKFVKATLLGN
ncbi:MAG: hypothetical protein CL398_04560 [Acidiferrobacteraceae bacterium]|nr:hypothetical protein [Acidiferrobacteraceae bacterium]